MDEKNSGREKEPEVYANEDWTKAMLEGNVLLPQRGLGLTGLTLDAVLQTPSVNWTELRRSVLSSDDIKKMAEVMAAMHRQRGIPVATETTRPTFPHPQAVRTINDDRLQRLWLSTKDSIFRALSRFIADDIGVAELAPPDARPGLISSFFSDPKNKQSVKKLVALTDATAQIIRGRKMKKLAELLRASYDKEFGVTTFITEAHSQIGKFLEKELTNKMGERISAQMLNNFLDSIDHS